MPGLLLAELIAAAIPDSVSLLLSIVRLKLAETMKCFSYDPTRSFRGWLRTLAHHAWSDFMASRSRHGQGTGDQASRSNTRN